ncbi:MAG: transcription antitermination factor NusB, partial [Brevundimonas sp.]|nr:transcription antitermination factor NusB [Brevundimonas sp.]
MSREPAGGRSSAARGRRLADKARAGTRPPRPRVEVADPRDDGPDIGVEARLAAGVLLNAALEGRGGLDAALSFREVSDLPGPDRAFARAVAMAALRRLGEIDQILDRKLQKGPPLAVRTILRVALAQMLILETPAFAAVSTAVKLAEREV